MANLATMKQKELFGHPVGLYVLFFTEMWERFSYYGMRAILVLYLVQSTSDTNAGLGWTNGEALALYGWYTMLVYVMSIPGGWIADKFLGQKKSVLYGGILLVAGHSILAIEQMWAFYTGLGLIIAGVGMLKPNISTMVGGLYAQGDIRRDKGFTIFYIGINVGAFLSSLIVGTVGEVYGWHYGFGLAGIGMALGLIQYVLGQKYLKYVGNFLGASVNEEEKAAMKKPLTKIEKDRVVVLFISFLLVIVFWGAFEQAGGLMNIYASEKTNRLLSFSLPFIGNEVPASWFGVLNSLFIIAFAPLFSKWWESKYNPNANMKYAIGMVLLGIGMACVAIGASSIEPGAKTASVSMIWLILVYFFHTMGELCISPVALSYVSKLVPGRMIAMMFGIWYLAVAIGMKLAGVFGEASEGIAKAQGLSYFFWVLTAVAVGLGIISALLYPVIKKLLHGVR